MDLTVDDILTATDGELVSGSRVQIITGVTIDSRTVSSGHLFVPLRGERQDGHDYVEEALNAGAVAALIKKDNPVLGRVLQRRNPACIIVVEDTLRALGNTGRLWRDTCPARIAAVTGSTGKTTTKEMAWSILKDRMQVTKNPGNWNNLIGLPLSLCRMDSADDAGIFELGMNEPGEMQQLVSLCDPDIGLITNIGPSHLERLQTVAGVAAEKAALFSGIDDGGLIIVNADDPLVLDCSEKSHARKITYGFQAADITATSVRASNCFGSSFDLHVAGKKVSVTLKFPGRHFVANALAAAAIAHAYDVPPAAIQQGLENFSGIPGRMEIITLGSKTVINDAYNANPVSMQSALSILSAHPFARRKIAVLGDMLELGEHAASYHRELGNQVAAQDIAFLFVIGKFASDVLEGALAGGMERSRVVVCDDFTTLTASLCTVLGEGDTVLLKGSRKMQMEQVLSHIQDHE